LVQLPVSVTVYGHEVRDSIAVPWLDTAFIITVVLPVHSHLLPRLHLVISPRRRSRTRCKPCVQHAVKADLSLPDAMRLIPESPLSQNIQTTKIFDIQPSRPHGLFPGDKVLSFDFA